VAGQAVGIVATSTTLAADLFDAALAARGRQALHPDEALLDAAILPAIAQVKAGRMQQAQAPMAHAVQALIDGGAGLVILACTEAPIALAGADAALQAACLDATRVLAQATLVLWQQQSQAGWQPM